MFYFIYSSYLRCFALGECGMEIEVSETTNYFFFPRRSIARGLAGDLSKMCFVGECFVKSEY